MLESIKIRNFQIHETETFKFDPYCTTFVGESDQGKSAVFRAIRWIMLNRPSGEAFMRQGSDQVSGYIRIDGREILRERGPGLNAYALDGHRFQAFGQDVPDEIAALLNVDDGNFQGQHDAPFWFMLSPGEVSRELNRIINLGLIDRTLANVTSELRSARATATVSEGRLKVAEADRKALEWVRGADESLKEAEEVGEALEENRRKRARLAEIIGEGERTRKTLADATQAKLDGEKAVLKGEETLRIQGEARKLSALLENLMEAEGQTSKTIIPDDWEALESAHAKLMELRNRWRLLNAVARRYGEIEGEQCEAKKDLERSKAELAKTTKGQECPLCGMTIGR